MPRQITLHSKEPLATPFAPDGNRIHAEPRSQQISYGITDLAHPIIARLHSQIPHFSRVEKKALPSKLEGRLLLAMVGIAATYALWELGAFHWMADTLSEIFPQSNPWPLKDVAPTLSYTPPSPLEPLHIALFTSYSTDKPERLPMSRKVAQNQMEYCKKNGYRYSVFEKNLADLSATDQSLPYWTKIAGILHLLYTHKNDSTLQWLIWLDDDAVVLNSHIQMEEWIHRYESSKPGACVIVTQDIPAASVDMNTGVIFVKNCEKSRQFFEELWNMRHRIFDYGKLTRYSDCPNQSCFHEQEAMHYLWRAHPRHRQIIQIIPQREKKGDVGINTFRRLDHYDLDRNMHLSYENKDPERSRCKITDFICQCTGLATRGRVSGDLIARNLRAECVDQLLSYAERNLTLSPFPH